MPHPDAADMAAFAHQVLAWAVYDFDRRGAGTVGASAPRAELDKDLAGPPPEQGAIFEDVLAEFAQKIVPRVHRTDHPRFLAFVPAAPTFYSVLGDWLAAALNSFPGLWLEGAAAAEVELVVLDWFKRFVGYPKFARGTLTAGGTEANLTALVTARTALDLSERPTAVLYAGDQRHRSIDRAAMVIGLTPDQVRAVPSDDAHRMRPDALREAIRRDRAAGLKPWAVAACAGATSTGAVDPLRELAGLCKAESVWLHADAAYGWPAVLVPEGKKLLDGLSAADSVTLDPHKWFAQPYEAGCVLVRDGLRLAEAFAQSADYLQDALRHGDEGFDLADHGLALTRRFRALKVWVSVKALGVGWYRELVARNLKQAEYAEERLRATGAFEPAAPRSLSVVCFRGVRPGGDPDRWHQRLAERARATGRAFVSTTRVGGRAVLRLCFVNWRTTSADVDEVVSLLAELAAKA